MTSFIVDFVMMFVVMVRNLILCINYEIENDESRLMMKTRLLPEQRRAWASTNPALFLIIQRCDIFFTSTNENPSTDKLSRAIN